MHNKNNEQFLTLIKKGWLVSTMISIEETILDEIVKIAGGHPHVQWIASDYDDRENIKNNGDDLITCLFAMSPTGMQRVVEWKNHQT
jgi:hypothetical protein